ncbi:putative mitochondrial protein AtMg00820 [Bidens hawaiensis]|uniref:putative mitochondrial protein AtMg00820 n=1 Tax=Bidens hawaiensis TaxID=980011 RepID=UPI00404A9FE6
MALQDSSSVEAIQEELQQFVRLRIWDFIDKPDWVKKPIIKRVFKCKKDDRGVIIRNKAWLVMQGFNQQEGVYYTEVYAPVAILEAICIFLAYNTFKNFKVYQIDVKSAFVNRELH